MVEGLIPDLPRGPLDRYREKASFNWKKLRLHMENEETLLLKMKIWNTLQKETLFQHPPATLSSREYRELTVKRIKFLEKIKLISVDDFQNVVKIHAIATALFQYDPSLGITFVLEPYAYVNIIKELGSKRHIKLLSDHQMGCIALTEMGSDNKNEIRTTASFDPVNKEFVLHTPDFEAAKCWQPNLGLCGINAVVFARLITPDGIDHGIHGFVAPLRDPVTIQPLTGIIIGDLGEKTGVNGVDNSFLMFEKYRIPQENLLNKCGDVSVDGKYFKNSTDQNFSTLGYSWNDIHAVGICEALLSCAVSIAVRYSGARKQFGSDNGEEFPVIEYQLQQWRLFPYVAASFILKNVDNILLKYVSDYQLRREPFNSSSNTSIACEELCALISAIKCVGMWITRDAIQDCREACGGHGYLKIAGLGSLRDDNDSYYIFGNDNNSLLLKTGLWLLHKWQRHLSGDRNVFDTPLGSLNFLSNFEFVIKATFSFSTTEEIMKPDKLLTMYQWLFCWLLRETHLKLSKSNSHAVSQMPYLTGPLAIVYAQYNMMLMLYEKAILIDPESNLQNVLLNLCSLFGSWNLEKHLPLLYQGGYAKGSEPARLIREGILQLCSDLKDNAIPLVDSLAPPDFVLNSVLGQSDGNVYRNMQTSLFSSPQVFERPSWWRDVVYWKESKL